MGARHIRSPHAHAHYLRCVSVALRLQLLPAHSCARVLERDSLARLLDVQRVHNRTAAIQQSDARRVSRAFLGKNTLDRHRHWQVATDSVSQSRRAHVEACHERCQHQGTSSTTQLTSAAGTTMRQSGKLPQGLACWRSTVMSTCCYPPQIRSVMTRSACCSGAAQTSSAN